MWFNDGMAESRDTEDRSRAGAATPARERLMDATEFLVAERGLAVSAREIAAHAGQRNNSAVIYHFGNLDGLLAATLQRRMDSLERRRMQLLDEIAPDNEPTISDLLTIMAEPALTIPYLEGATHYARFVEQIRHHPVISEAESSIENWPGMTTILRSLNRKIPSHRRLQKRRINMMATAMYALVADYERRGELITPRGRAAASAELVTVLTAILTAVQA
jgi:AcrR family transcriptional regulator